MKLNYRGADYEIEPTGVELQDSGVHGKYRGCDVNFHVAASGSQPTASVLSYRGVQYHPGQQVGGASVVQSAPDEARNLMMRQQRTIKIRQQALLERAAEEVGLTLSTQVSNYWGRIQGKVNPSFRATYHRSHVALS